MKGFAQSAVFAFVGGSVVKMIFTILNHVVLGAPALIFIAHDLANVSMPVMTAWLIGLILGHVFVGAALCVFVLEQLHFFHGPLIDLSAVHIPTPQELVSMLQSIHLPNLPALPANPFHP